MKSNKEHKKEEEEEEYSGNERKRYESFVC